MSQRKIRTKCRTLIVLGSGGHTAEMLNLLRTIDLNYYLPRKYVVADTDVAGPNSSLNKAKNFEQRWKEKEDSLDPNVLVDSEWYSISTIPRSREVGQSWLTTIWTFAKSLPYSFIVVLRTKPDLILVNGPGTCVPICLSGLILKLLGIHHVRIIYSESFACVTHLSFTGKILYRFVDKFFVQWPQLKELYPKSIYTGRIPLEHFKNPNSSNVPRQTDGLLSKKSYVLVTVGSTKFDQLIKSIDSTEFVNELMKRGYEGLHVQYGKGTYKPENIVNIKNFKVECFDFKEKLNTEIDDSSLVISHAGAGSILETLSARKTLVVVPNETLMNNHQLQLGSELERLNYLRVVKCQQLLESIGKILDKMDNDPLYVFPSHETATFSRYVDSICK